MPNLPLPLGGTALSGGDLPVSDASSVLAVFPDFLKSSDPAPVRDAIVAALVAMFTSYQDLAAYCAAQSDVLRATGTYLDGLLNDRGVRRQVGENDDDYRARGLAFQQVVTPAAIVAAANSILAPVSNVEAQCFDATLDRAFLGGEIGFGTVIGTRSFPGFAPHYLDRLYPDDEATNGVARDNCDPGGMWLFSDLFGRYFVLRIPDIATLDSVLQLCYAGVRLDPSDALVPELGGATPASSAAIPSGYLASSLGGTGLFLGDGSNSSGAEADGSVATFMFATSTDSARVYQLIANTVERIKGHSMRWKLYVDPNLTS